MTEKPYEPKNIYSAKDLEGFRDKYEVDLRNFENLSISK